MCKRQDFLSPPSHRPVSPFPFFVFPQKITRWIPFVYGLFRMVFPPLSSAFFSLAALKAWVSFSSD